MRISSCRYTEALFMDKIGYYYDTYLWKWPKSDFNGADHEEEVNVDKFFGLRRLNYSSPYQSIFNLLSDRSSAVLYAFADLAEEYVCSTNNERFYVALAKKSINGQYAESEMIADVKLSLSEAIDELNSLYPTEEFTKYVNDQERYLAGLSGRKKARSYSKTKLKVVFQDDWRDKEVVYRFGY